MVSQPRPQSDRSPYFELAAKNNLKIEFRPFIHVEEVSAKEFRQERIDILLHTGVIFTSKTAIDNFFRICDEMRISVPDTMKYFCMTEAIAFYLQKYIVYRKRKIFFGTGKLPALIEVMQKHKDENFLLPVSDSHKDLIPQALEKAGYKYTKAIIYRTVSSDLSDIASINYDVIVFYSPSGIKSLLKNFPEFEQKEIKIASFGLNTAKAVKEAGLRVDIQAPMPEAPSMTMALDQFIAKHNKSS